jgi:hypothetical protein
MLLWATPFSASAMRVAPTKLLCGKPIISTADLVFSLVLQGLPLGANELGQSGSIRVLRPLAQQPSPDRWVLS